MMVLAETMGAGCITSRRTHVSCSSELSAMLGRALAVKAPPPLPSALSQAGSIDIKDQRCRDEKNMCSDRNSPQCLLIRFQVSSIAMPLFQRRIRDGTILPIRLLWTLMSCGIR
jgi:hypothetical protein